MIKRERIHVYVAPWPCCMNAFLLLVCCFKNLLKLGLFFEISAGTGLSLDEEISSSDLVGTEIDPRIASPDVAEQREDHVHFDESETAVALASSVHSDGMCLLKSSYINPFPRWFHSCPITSKESVQIARGCKSWLCSSEDTYRCLKAGVSRYGRD